VSNPIRVLIVDDHPIVREGVVRIVSRQSDMIIAGEAATGEAGVDLFLKLRPDVALIDLALPGIDGTQAMLEIRERAPDARFVAMSSFAGDEDIHRALKAGAKGYVLKDAEPVEIVSAIRAVHAGLRHIPPFAANALAARVQYEPLTEREIEVLQAIARGQSNKGIAAETGLSESAIKARVNEILSKLGVDDRTAAVTIALQRGIIHL
jgi:DNA-binding NarL/FixJ family response regulator